MSQAFVVLQRLPYPCRRLNFAITLFTVDTSVDVEQHVTTRLKNFITRASSSPLMGKATGWQQHREWGGRRRRQLLTDQTPISVAYSACWCSVSVRYWKTRCSVPRIQPRSAAHLHTTAVATPVARPESCQHYKYSALHPCQHAHSRALSSGAAPAQTCEPSW